MSSNTREPTDWFSDDMQRRIAKRYRANTRFKWYGIIAIGMAFAALLWLLQSIVAGALPGFQQTQIELTFEISEAKFGDLSAMSEEDRRDVINRADYGAVIRGALRAEFPEVTARRDIRRLTNIVSSGARSKLREVIGADPTIVGSAITLWVPASDDVHTITTGSVSRDTSEDERRITDQEIAWVDALDTNGRIRTVLSGDFFSGGDSREPELAGIWGTVVGSILTLFVTLVVSFPIGVASAVYLEEFARKNRWSDFIEVNINNLAAVPSIIYGLLGLAIFLNVFHMSRSAPLVGGLTLALMTLPTLIIAARSAMKAVPPSIRDAAIGLGASPLQVVAHHVLPLAMPGVLTGTIIGMSRALGETAPLLMIGMVAFIADVPGGINDASTVLPVQIYIWADSPERAFVEKTAAATLVLLTFLVLMNASAVWLRSRFEQKW